MIGAIFLDQGYRAATKVFLQNIGDLAEWSDENFKGQLQQASQDRTGDTPHYRVVATGGPGHKREYTAEVLLGDRVGGTGRGRRNRPPSRRPRAMRSTSRARPDGAALQPPLARRATPPRRWRRSLRVSAAASPRSPRIVAPRRAVAADALDLVLPTRRPRRLRRRLRSGAGAC